MVDRHGVRRYLKHRVLLVVGFAWACLAVGCHPQVEAAPEIALDHEITPWPLHVGRAGITLSLHDASTPVTGARITLEGDMSHPGMSPVFGEARELVPGSYHGNIDLAMAGDWVLVVHITLANGYKLERQIELKAVEAK